MSFLSDNKLLFGAVGIAVSSAVAGFVVARVLGRKSDEVYEDTKMHLESSPVKSYVMEYGLREPLPLRKLREASMNHKWHMIICSADEAQLMRLLLQLIKAKKAIEIGIYTGYNTLSMAMALPPDGKVVACDITDEFMNDVQSRRYFKEAGVESKIDLRLQPATTTLDELLSAGEAESYDMVFIDANKESYDVYYEKSLQLVRKGGLIVVDNVLWGGKVCDPKKRVSDEETKSLHNINVKLHGDSRVAISFLPLSDGVTIAMKL